jgi:hypothetical protein
MHKHHPFAPGAIERHRSPLKRLIDRAWQLLDRAATALVWALFISVMCGLAVMAGGLLVMGIAGVELFPGARLL